jgi:hypothetical protein
MELNEMDVNIAKCGLVHAKWYIQLCCMVLRLLVARRSKCNQLRH